jgi:hypothetical protein
MIGAGAGVGKPLINASISDAWPVMFETVPRQHQWHRFDVVI